MSYCRLFGKYLDLGDAFWVGPWHVHCGYVEIAKGVHDGGVSMHHFVPKLY
jgi:hypothetical protein